MKPIDYVRKYNLTESKNFNHNLFAIDFGNDFLSRLEVYRTFDKWSESYFWKLYEEMENKWANIENKIVGNLPEKLFDYMHREIFIPTFINEFDRIKKGLVKINSSNITDLKKFLEELVNGKSFLLNNSAHRIYFLSYDIGDSSIEWDHKYTENALGELNYRPNSSYQKIKQIVYDINDYLINCCFDELTSQLFKLAAARASIQFRIRKEEEDRRKKQGDTFNWWDFIRGISSGRKLDINEYIPYFNLIKVSFSDETELTEKIITSAYKKLSLIYHPDKSSGNHEKFIEITEAKNKCLEYIKSKER